jgi:hypothetical protein
MRFHIKESGLVGGSRTLTLHGWVTRLTFSNTVSFSISSVTPILAYVEPILDGLKPQKTNQR